MHPQIPIILHPVFQQHVLTCHTTNPGWKPTTFNHSSFPLTLGHSTPACADCHIGGNYTTTPTDCYACHQADFTATTNPNHTSSGFPHTCLYLPYYKSRMAACNIQSYQFPADTWSCRTSMCRLSYWRKLYLNTYRLLFLPSD